MGLKLQNINFNRAAQPVTAQVILMDEHNCNVSVNIKLEKKPVEAFNLEEIDRLARAAAKHLVTNA
ncbi:MULTISPECIES: hypothetical protein [unclassified Pseudomonas]|jgi:hypothetical protein|uniref:hypothetical protein n=1 Tax=unclassified Pseudomonas TaxID=196821 RepID=UPI000C885B95|nr:MULTISPECIES: hypothetical protein [unclassified Pseudomonas]PNA96593.1 hypothetical protein C1X74_16600 [Pseudomonas sp. GW460-5]PNB58302.1 hypothetical protein C1X73_14540 [Pseudomonas sp. FW305-130]